MMRGSLRMSILAAALATAAVAATDPGSVGAPAGTALDRLISLHAGCPGMSDGLSAYFAMDYDTAAERFAAADCPGRGAGAATAWLALTLWRDGHQIAAMAVARRALALEPGNALGHYALAQAANPQLGHHDFVDADSAWVHLRAAVRLDPDLADAWTMVWVESFKRGDAARQKAALRALHDRKLLAPGLVAMWRWGLGCLPENTLLLVNGDNDTFPPVMLQVIEEFRPDVAVVNLTMLNVDAYVHRITDLHGLPLPEPQAVPKGYGRHRAEAQLSQRLMARWAAAHKDGSLGRPLHVSITVPSANLPVTIRDHLVLAGPTYVHDPDRASGGPAVDVDALQRNLARLNVHAATRSYEGVHHVSPVTASAASLAGNLVSLAERLVFELVGLERYDDAAAAYRLMERLVDEADLEDRYADELHRFAAFFADRETGEEP